MNVGSLFSGIGGMDAGLARAGCEHVFFCESDPWRREVLTARWSGVPVYEDVCAVGRPGTGEAVREGNGLGRDRRPDLLCGGFPCQDLSVAGRRRGLAGERSGLFFEFARIIDAFRPRWVLVENVPGLLSSNGGRDFGVVLGTLADLGYGVGWRVLDSRFFGVPQRRRRVFVVGARVDGDPRAAAERAGQVLAVGSRCSGHFAAGGEAGPDAADASTVSTLAGSGKSGGWRIGADEAAGGQLVAETLREHPRPGSNSNGQIVPYPVSAFDWQAGAPQSDNDQSGGKGRKWIVRAGDYTGAIGETRRDAIGGPGVGVRRLTPRECERLQGLPDDWTLLDAKTPDSRRYSALGDAVTANVAEWIGHRLIEANQ